MTTSSSRAAEWRAGWRVVLCSALGIGTGAALYQYVASLFIAPAEAELGWSRGDFSLIGATPLIGAFSAPLIGRAADRYGVRPVAVIATLTIAAAFLGLSQMRGSIAEAVAWMALLGIAVPGTTGIVYSRCVTGWFDAGRGLALGVTTAGISVGALLATPLVGWAIDAGGYRGGYLALALLALGIGLPAILVGVREVERTADAPMAASLDADMVRPITVKAWATRRFWLLAAIMLLVNIPSAGVLTQLAPLLEGKGVPAGTVWLLLSAYAVSVLVGRIAIGWSFDRAPAARVTAVVTLIAALGALTFHSATPLAFVGFGVLTVGLLQGAETDVLAYFVARMFPHRQFGSVYGWQVTAGLAGTAGGVIGFGQLYDRFGGYDEALVIGAMVLAAVAALTLACHRYVGYPGAARALVDPSQAGL